MRKVKNRSLKGKRLEKYFAQELKKLFPSAETEIKPRIINIKKDFWGLFDGLTFIRKKKKFIFWQIKGVKISKKFIKNYWRNVKAFNNSKIIIILVEKYKNNWKIYTSPNKYLKSIKDLKKLV
jgi:hypothetical protein